MKRIGNLYSGIISIENLNEADRKARKKKKYTYGIAQHDKNREANIQQLHETLCAGSFKTSPYSVFKVYEPKERDVYRLPYFPDRIMHHAVMNVMEPLFRSWFTADTYSCIKGKGIHNAAERLEIALTDVPGTKYCLKLDIKKFYPSIDHWILKTQLERKIKDKHLLMLLYGVIDSAPGVPIGNYLSQYFANFYLTGFDHWIKEEKRAKYYFRYADDLVLLAPDKVSLHKLLADIKQYLYAELKLTVKGNYQIFPVAARGIDFVGYVFYHTHTMLRKRIKKNFARMLKKRPNKASIASYYGWAKHANCKHLLKKLLNNDTTHLRTVQYPAHQQVCGHQITS